MRHFVVMRLLTVCKEFCIKIISETIFCKMTHHYKMSHTFRVTRLCDIPPIGLLWEAHYDFLNWWSSPKEWWQFGLHFDQAHLLHLHIFCCRYLSFQIWFDVDVLDFQIELCCRYFGIFLARRLFGLLFEKKIQIFWSPCICFTFYFI